PAVATHPHAETKADRERDAEARHEIGQAGGEIEQDRPFGDKLDKAADHRRERRQERRADNAADELPDDREQDQGAHARPDPEGETTRASETARAHLLGGDGHEETPARASLDRTRSGCMSRSRVQRCAVIARNSVDQPTVSMRPPRGRGRATGTISTTEPGRTLMTTIRSPRSTASSMLWVMNTTVVRVASQMRTSSS